MPSSASKAMAVNRKLLKRPDEFVLTLRRFFEKLAKNTRALWIVIGGFAAVLVSGFLYLDHMENRLGEGRTALYQANQTLERELEAAAPAMPKPEKGQESQKDAAPVQPEKDLAAIAYKPLDVNETFPEAVGAYREVGEMYAGTRPGYEAQLALGNLYYDHGQAEKAVDWYLKARRSAPGAFEKAVAAYAAGSAYEDAAQYQKAVEQYEQALGVENSGLKAEILLGIGRSHELSNELENARKAYDKVLSEAAGTPQAEKAKLSLGRLSN